MQTATMIVSEFECYTRKKGDAEVGLGGSVVKRLKPHDYHVYMDNFFSSVISYKDLLNDGIHCIGTLQTNHKYFPLDLLAYTKCLAKRGDMMTRQEGNLTVTVWQDKRVVTSMSTGHNPDQTNVVKRKMVDESVINMDCPESIVDHNRFMGGVDKGDQIRKYYHVKVKSCKAYKYIFWFVFEVCVLCEHYTQQCTHTKTYLQFRQELARQLVGEYCSCQRKHISCTNVHHD